VERHGHAEGWQERLAAIQVAAAREADGMSARGRAERLLEFERAIDATMDSYSTGLAEGTVQASANDVVRMVTLGETLRGPAAASADPDAIRAAALELRVLLEERLADRPAVLAAVVAALEPDGDCDAG
jgi:hypothetical protein